MNVGDSSVTGTVSYFGRMADLAGILSEAGFSVSVGSWAIRLDQFANVFKLAYVGNLRPASPFDVVCEGDDFPVDVLAANCERLATCLRRNSIGFDFTHFSGDEDQELRTYKYQP